MQGFLQENNSLIWTLHHETVRIEPWGRDSLRVRATVSAGIRDDLLRACSTNDRRTDNRLAQHPGQRQLRQGIAALLCQRLELLDGGQRLLLHQVVHKGV